METITDGGSGSENERTVSSDVEQSDLSADDSDLSDLESLILRRRRATKRDTTVAFSPLKDGSKRFRMRGTSTESPPVLYPLKERSGSSHKRVSASKQKSTRTIQRKQVTPRHSNSATPGSSRHSTPATDEFTSPRNPTLSSHRDNVARSAANPGTPITPRDDTFGGQSGTPLTHHPKGSEDRETAKILSEVHNMLHTLVKRVEGTEKELKEIKRHISTPSSSDSSAKKKEVPNIVRSETRKMYKTLLDECEDFGGFFIGDSYNWRSDENQAVVRKLMSEVIAINPKFQGCDVREAAQTYYKTLCQEQSLERRGKSGERKKSRRRRERTARKLEERLSVFKKRVYSQEDQQKWMKVLVPAMMSSEESADEENVNYVKDLPWRASIVKEFFSDLDKQFAGTKSAQAKRQTKSRIASVSVSYRQAPQGIPTWALNDRE